MNMSRRQFLAASAGTLAVLSSATRAQSHKSVIVLGAGLSGLSAAYELAQKGYRVTVIEARDRIGGRVSTLREAFRDGQHVELGGETIGDGYRRFLGYADKFGIKYEIVPSDFATGGTVADLQKRITNSAVIGGKLYPSGSILDANPYKLPTAESGELPPTQLFRHIAAMAAEVRSDVSKLAAYDAMSLAQALRKRGVSDAMIRLMNISLNYNSIETVSMGGILWESRRRAAVGTKAVRVAGGNDQLTDALWKASKDLGVAFSMGVRVTKINYATKSVTVSVINSKGKSVYIEADLAVCTIPFSVLRTVAFSPALPREKQKTIDDLAYTRITKVFIQSKRKAWDERSLGSTVWTDTPCERIFNVAGKKGDERGIFTIWTDGEGAAIPERLDDKARVAWGKTTFGETLPFMKNGVETAATKSWTNDEFVRGAYSHFTAGQLSELQPHLKTPVGPIHFAGEHTAENAPGMEGALESAERAVREIMRLEGFLGGPRA